MCVWGGGGGGGRDKCKVETFRSTLYQASQFCAWVVLSFHCQRGGKNVGGVGHSCPINETTCMLLCRVIGNVHTVASMYWRVVGGEYELGVYADGGVI